ncbi:MAG: fibronectin type III domain-containing protein [Candidatus Poribacteria bacterium]
MNKLKITLLMAFIFLTIFPKIITAHAAVTSIGEINVEGNNQGKMLASSKATLIATIIIDRSLAEPGEEIKTIEFVMPSGFSADPSEVTEVVLNAKASDFTPKVSGASLRIELAELILDVNTVAEIVFKVSTPGVTMKNARFLVRLRNFHDEAIGDFVRPGPADGKPNNDSFTLTVIPNIPPPAPTGLNVEVDPTGENDVFITWEKSTDPDVSGYFIYRDNNPRINVAGIDTTTFSEINVQPGTHAYTIEAYKGSGQLVSPKTEARTVNVSEDRKAPESPLNFTIKLIGDGVELKWQASPTVDVVKYVVSFGKSMGGLELIREFEVEVDREEYGFTDRRQLEIGRFIYSVEAVDEAQNRSEAAIQELILLDKPYPNPFTPLSSDPKFNRVTFSARGLGDVEGEFTVKVYNIDGILVKELVAPLGERELTWDGKDDDGKLVESGVYIYQIQVGEEFSAGTVIVAK